MQLQGIPSSKERMSPLLEKNQLRGSRCVTEIIYYMVPLFKFLLSLPYNLSISTLVNFLLYFNALFH